MTEYERREWAHIRMCAEAHFEQAIRDKNEAALTRMGLILDAHATVDPDREGFEDAFNRVVRPHLAPVPVMEDIEDDIPF